MNGIVADLGENDICAGVCGGINYAEKNRNADAVDNFGFGKINDNRFAARVNLPFAFALDFFAA